MSGSTSRSDIEQAIKRLKRDVEILSTYKSSSYQDEDPQALLNVVKLLEEILKSNK
jgi:hypothetical protein